MKKVNFNERLNKKNSIIAVIIIAVFVIIGILAAVLGHVSYLNSRDAKILNYTNSPSDTLFMRSDGLTLCYKYSEGTQSVSIGNIITLSKGATYKILCVLDEHGNKLEVNSISFDVSENQHYFVVLDVISMGAVHKNGYVIELIAESDFSPETSSLIKPGDLFQYVSAE